MLTKRTIDEIRAIISSHYPRASQVRELTGGLASQTFSFEANGHRYVFKMGTRKEVHEKEQWITQCQLKMLDLNYHGGAYRQRAHQQGDFTEVVYIRRNDCEPYNLDIG